MNIEDIPVWTDCPFRDQIPPEYVARRGGDEDLFILEWREGERVLHVDLLAAGSTERDLAVAVNALNMARKKLAA